MQVQQLPSIAIRPPRLNFVGWCIVCARRWCEDPKCVAWHADSIWGPCDRCDGTGLQWLGNCNCVSGLIEHDSQDLADQAWIRAATARSPLDVEDESYRAELRSSLDNEAEFVVSDPLPVKSASKVPAHMLVFDIDDPDAWL